MTILINKEANKYITKRSVRFFVLLYLCLSALEVTAQLRYPVVGTFCGKSAQGMAIWRDEGYLFNDGGHCRVIDLKSGSVLREFNLVSSGKNTHVNSACFGTETVGEGDIPVIYVSEYNMPSRCFVECIKDSTSMLLQTIQIQNNGKPVFVQSWIPDSKNKFLYAIARVPPAKGLKNSDRVKVSQYRLPYLSEGKDVVFDIDDCIDSFVVEFPNAIQGGVVKGRYMFLPSGLQESARGRFNAERAIQVINLKKKRLVKKVGLTYLTTNEPEDVDFYKGKILLYCGQEGGIYKVKF